jgi:hypothetical protein
MAGSRICAGGALAEALRRAGEKGGSGNKKA